MSAFPFLHEAAERTLTVTTGDPDKFKADHSITSMK